MHCRFQSPLYRRCAPLCTPSVAPKCRSDCINNLLLVGNFCAAVTAIRNLAKIAKKKRDTDGQWPKRWCLYVDGSGRMGIGESKRELLEWIMDSLLQIAPMTHPDESRFKCRHAQCSGEMLVKEILNRYLVVEDSSWVALLRSRDSFSMLLKCRVYCEKLTDSFLTASGDFWSV